MRSPHGADLRVDSLLTRLSRYEGVPAEELRGATHQGTSKDLTCIKEASGLGVALSAVPGDDVENAQQGKRMGT